MTYVVTLGFVYGPQQFFISVGLFCYTFFKVLSAIHFDINKVSMFRGRTYEIYQKQCMK
jgi:hypothetical protein